MMHVLRQSVKASLLAVMMMGGGWCHAVENPDNILGYWRVMDDRSGFAKAIARFSKNEDGTYVGIIMRTIPRPDYKPIDVCQKCPAPFTNRKVIGMPIVWFKETNSTKANERGWDYVRGHAIDPLQGKIYQGKARLSPDQRRLVMRGYVGVSMLGRSQIWIREEADSPLLEGLPKFDPNQKLEIEVPQK
jgi:hypothetical protein